MTVRALFQKPLGKSKKKRAFINDTLTFNHIKLCRCRPYLDRANKIECDSFIEVTVGGVEGQNLYNLKQKTSSLLCVV